MALLKIIGYWKGSFAEQHPDPSAFVDPHWDKEEKQQVIDYEIVEYEDAHVTDGWWLAKTKDAQNAG